MEKHVHSVEWKRERDRDRQTDKQAGRQTDRDRQTDRQTDRQRQRERQRQKHREVVGKNAVRILNDALEASYAFRVQDAIWKVIRTTAQHNLYR